MTDYFVDYTNGLDTNNGLRTTGNVISAHSHTPETITCAGLHGTAIGNGSFVYVTAGGGIGTWAYTSGWDDATHIITLDRALAGVANNDVFDLITPEKTILATTGAAKTAGDNIYLRTATSHLPGANVTTSSAGSKAAYISLIGCSTTDSTDFWHDGTTTAATIDFSAAAYYFYGTKSWWNFKNIIFKNGTPTYAVFRLNAVSSCVINGCTFNNATNNVVAARVEFSNDVEFNSCAFEGVGTTGAKSSMYISTSTVKILNSTFNATVSTNVAVGADASTVLFKNCTFGATNAYATRDFEAYYGSKLYFQNCRFYTAAHYYYPADAPTSALFCEDDGQVYGAMAMYTGRGSVTKKTDVVRAGGATSSALMLPASIVGAYCPLSLTNVMFSTGSLGDFKVWCPASESTITLYMSGYGTWTTVPTNVQLWVEVEYVSNDTDGSIARTIARSTAILTQADQAAWVAFPVTFTPHVASFAYVTVYLTLYESGKGVYVDVNPILS